MKTIIKLILILVVAIPVNAQYNPCNRDLPASNYPSDTTITLPSGSSITLNRCEYFDVRNCITIMDMNDSATLRKMRMNMTDSKGNILLTSGMVYIDFKNCANKCLEVPMVIRVRINRSSCVSDNQMPNLYITNANGNWDLQPTNSYRVDTINGVAYLTYKSKCGGGVNCDVLAPNRIMKLKAARKKKILSFTVSAQCPPFYLDSILPKEKRKARVPLLCTKDDNLTIVVKTRNIGTGKVAEETYKLTALEHKNRKVRCGIKNKKILFWSFRKVGKNKTKAFKKYFLPA